MPRYTSIQAFTDQRTEIVKVQAVAEGAGSRDPSKPGPKPHRVEQLVQNTGSTVGASSAAFDVYRASRRREFDRIEKLEQKVQDEQDGNAFSTKIETNKALADDKTSKNAAKRNKKKAKAKMMKAANPGGGGANDKTKEDALAGLKRALQEDSDLEDNADTLEAYGEATSEPLTVQEEVEKLLKKAKED